jgi:hypothetical protein
MRRDAMIEWIPVAVNEKPLLRGKQLLPEYSATVIGSSVVLRWFGGGLTGLSIALTTVPFASEAQAKAWVAANRVDFQYEAQARSA